MWYHAVAVLILVAPLTVSMSLAAWAAAWSEPYAGPVDGRLHRLLIAAQLGVAGLLLFAGGRLALVSAALLYCILGVGAGLLLIRKGRVDCGCWGSSGSRLSWRLVVFDLLLSALGVAGAVLVPDIRLSVTLGVMVGLTIVSAAFLGGVVLPAAKRLYPELKDRAAKYKPWVYGRLGEEPSQ